MIDKGFLISRFRRDSRFHHCSRRTSNVILLAGISILIVALIFMLLNLDRADSFVTVWVPFMIAGVILVFLSLVIKLVFNDTEEKTRRNRTLWNTLRNDSFEK